MNLMEHEVMAAPIGAEAAGDEPIRLVDYEDVKTCIDYALKFGYSLQGFREEVDTWEDFVLMTDTDTISREAALKMTFTHGINENGLLYVPYCEVKKRINNLPPVTPKRPTGEFLGTEYDGYADGNPVYYEWRCSACGCTFEDEEPTYKFCPNCGAKMKPKGKR